MPDYRKKNRNIFFSSAKRGKGKITRGKTEDIKMTPTTRNTKKSQGNTRMKVVAGNKLQRKRKFKFITAVAVFLVLLVFIFQIIFPAGIIQTVKNTVSIFGTGTYPFELSGNNTSDVVSMGNYYYVLSDTTISAFANSGKKLFDYPHGFEFPILKTSRYGAILFNQGNDNALIFTTGGLKETIQSEEHIINATISDSGVYALVTESDSYACVVSVFSKFGKNIYEWYSAESTVNNIVLSSNGKKIAVSTYDTASGKFKSKVEVLDFKSADAEFSNEFEGLVYSLSNRPSGRFAVVTSNKIKFIKWNNKKSEEYSNDYDIQIFKEAYHGFVAVFGRESDHADNRIAVFSKDGKLKYEFKFNKTISDICLFGGHIYCISDTEVYLLDQDGKILRESSVGFGVTKISVTATNTLITVTDNSIEKIKLEEEKTK